MMGDRGRRLFLFNVPASTMGEPCLWVDLRLCYRTERIQAHETSAKETRSSEWVERQVLERVEESVGVNRLRMGEPARQVARELRSHLSQLRPPQPK